MDRLAAAEARLSAILDRFESVADTIQPAGSVDGAVHEALVAEYDRLTGHVDQLAVALEEARGDNRALETRLAELAAENADLRTLSEAAPPVGTPDTRLLDAEAFAEEALQELDAAKAELAGLKTEVETLGAENAALKAALAKAEAQGAQRQAELFRLETANEAAAKRLDQTIARLDRAIAE